jgi:hypothetical protein
MTIESLSWAPPFRETAQNGLARHRTRSPAACREFPAKAGGELCRHRELPFGDYTLTDAETPGKFAEAKPLSLTQRAGLATGPLSNRCYA